ncbi:39S ribosomal protein L51, mitochondrial [Sticta canariensis]|nr:39S ribosomal protein L51, mitochondrial [Sticta canariensis]
MPVRAIQRLSTSQNGVDAFILQCKRLDFHYCDWAGSSKGMNAFLKQLLRPFAAQHPQIEIHVSPRPSRHPVIRGTYINGKEKAICVKNLEREQVLQKVELLRDASGEKVRRVKSGRVVTSVNESIRGIWSPMHGAKLPVLD